jgi:hypothetical protein
MHKNRNKTNNKKTNNKNFIEILVKKTKTLKKIIYKSMHKKRKKAFIEYRNNKINRHKNKNI